MDRKSILTLVVCFVLLMLWMPLVNVIFPPKPLSPAAIAAGRQAATNAAAARLANATTPGTNAPSPIVSNPTLPADAWVRPTTEEETLNFDNAESRYVFTSHGGALKEVELREYPESVGRFRPAVGATQRFAKLNAGAQVPALTYFGGPLLEDNVPYQLAPFDRGVRATKTLTNGLTVTKEFVIATNHLITATVRIENRSSHDLELPVQQMVIGTATPISPRDNGQFLGVQWYDGNRVEFINQAWFANHPGGCALIPGTPRTEFLSAGTNNVVWAALHNQFFTLITAPETNGFRVVAHKIDLPSPTPEERAADSKVVMNPIGYQAALVYPPETLHPGGAITRQVELFAGPKEYDTLARLSKNRDLAMNFTSIFAWFAKVLLLSMNALHNHLGFSYGFAIIAITVIIKALFWPLTQASTRSMKRMQTLQPQMKALQEKYKDDPRKMNQKLMEFMKENKVSPLGGCLPILLQIPVFMGFYQMLQSSIELRGASFLWAADLSQPDTVAVVFGFPINPLPLIMGATQFWQARMTPPSPGVDPVQQKMMQYMPLMFLFILYNFSSGLALYWTVQNLLSILQMKLTKVGGVKRTAPAPAAGNAGRRKS